MSSLHLSLEEATSPRRPRTLSSLRWKLFAVISCATAAPIALLTLYFPQAQVVSLEAAMTTKAGLIASMLSGGCQSAIAFDDAETARETFESAVADPDLAALVLFRADGSVLESRGNTMLQPVTKVTARQVIAAQGRIRVLEPIVTREGPTGTLAFDLSMNRVQAQVEHVRRTGLAVGLLALLAGCAAAFWVGRSFGGRIGRVEAQAIRVTGGDLSDDQIVDDSDDEIGQLSRAFRAMIRVIEQKVGERTAALNQSREQYRLLLETTDTVPFQLEPEPWRFTYVGPQVGVVSGLAREDWQAATFWSERLSPDDASQLTAALRRALAGHAAEELEMRLMLAANEERWVRVSIAPSDITSVQVVRGFMFDVTERRRLQSELTQAQKLESVGRLAAGVAHEINTPIQFISDNAEFVKTSFAELLPVLAKYRELRIAAAQLEPQLSERCAELEALEERADVEFVLAQVPDAIDRSLEGLSRVTSIVRSMKVFAHPDQGARAAADLNAAISSTLVIARNEYKYVADVVTELGDLPDVDCYLGELNQVFLNIIVNAAHAITDVVQNTEARGLITVKTRREDDAVCISISDTGGGIPDAIREKVFDPFFTTKGVGRGTGQGLAIARNVVVDKHGGTLTFESCKGEGTTFLIRLPTRTESVPALAAA